MTDITADFNVYLKDKGAEPVLPTPYDLQHIETFLQEAYSIYARVTDLYRELCSIRPAYLSAAQPSRRRHVGDNTDRARPLTDTERDAIDAQSKQLLRQLNGAITGLKQAEDVRNQTYESVALSKRAQGGLMGLGRWAAGGAQTAKSPQEELEEAARETIKTVRENIISYLQQKLGEAMRVQSEMMDIRLTREVEKSKSILAKSAGNGHLAHSFDHAQEPTSAEYGLTQEQLQLFAEENSELLRHYEDQLDQVRTAEKSILEISELHSTLHANLTQQSENISQLVQDSYLTTENLGKGNKELKRASERKSTAQAVFWSTCGFCAFLVVWDLIF
ncbi:syntaxin [Sphaerulina musiva SO2202]|uniref:Syntaxin n=1 Tax=Sphaerulina musiva (strain SO2202) TaxID=692275 RepID=M3CJ77_SPHMS|nr:syntaxin [Sphaerulina musiva SO2202]EMF13848.1 syntaxin [Sphaerulina musiva SO2202]